MTITAGAATFFTAADSINPGAVAALEVDGFFGYPDGQWADAPAIKAEHPNKPVESLTVVLANLGDGADFERGDLTPAQAPAFVRMRLAAGVHRPIAYGSIADFMPAVINELAGAGFKWPGDYRRLSAHYGWPGRLPGLELGQHICGPYTCGSPVQCDGTQWIDRGPYDESLLAHDWYGSSASTAKQVAAAAMLARPICAVVAHPSGKGYWTVAQDGGVFAFGEAPPLGAHDPVPGANLKPGHLVVDAAATPTGNGLWLTASDGAIFALGDAGYLGSIPGLHVLPSSQGLSA